MNTQARLTKLYIHQCFMVIYICIKFDEILFRGYLVIANYMDFKPIQGLLLRNYQGQPDQT